MLTKGQRKYLAALAFARKFRREQPLLALQAQAVGLNQRGKEWRDANRDLVRKYNREYMAARRARLKRMEGVDS